MALKHLQNIARLECGTDTASDRRLAIRSKGFYYQSEGDADGFKSLR